jgi:hypothetical protein
MNQNTALPMLSWPGSFLHPTSWHLIVYILYERTQNNWRIAWITAVAVQKLERGDISELETLFTRHQVRAVRTAFLILQDEAAHDVV